MRWDGIRWRVTDDILSNGLYDRLLKDTRTDGFIAKLKQRWHTLRNSVITVENINSILDANYRYLDHNGIYQRERIAWPNTELLNENSATYTTDWLRDRIAFLDEALDNLDVVTSNTEINHQFKWKVTPNPSYGLILIESEINIKFLQVYSQDGLLLKEVQDDHITQIDIQSLPTGIYFLKVADESGLIDVKRIILMH